MALDVVTWVRRKSGSGKKWHKVLAGGLVAACNRVVEQPRQHAPVIPQRECCRRCWQAEPILEEVRDATRPS